jgi:hypothetical protein
VKRIIAMIGLLLLIHVCVVASVGPIWGSWSADLTLSPLQTAPFSAFHSRLDVGLTYGAASLSMRGDFEVDGWLWQSFEARVTVPFFSAESNLLFWADPWTFCYANASVTAEVGVMLARVTTAFLGSSFEGSVLKGTILEIATVSSPVTIRSLTRFGAETGGILFMTQTASSRCEPWDVIAPAPNERFYVPSPTQTQSAFSGQDFIIESTFWGCVTFGSTTTIGPAGFESQAFSLDVQSIAGVPFNFLIATTFTVQTHSVTIAPSIGFGAGCFGTHVLGELVTNPGGTEITAFNLYGMDLFIDTPTFGLRSLSLFDTSGYSLYEKPGYGLLDSVWIARPGYDGVCGHAGEEIPEYWQVLELAVRRIHDNGARLEFLVLTFFSDDTSLFDWGKSEFRAAVTVMPGLTLRSAVTLRASGLSDWALGLDITW